MISQKDRTYFLLTGLFILGYCWLALAMFRGVDSKFTVCPIKNISGYPCPSCGSTRSVLMLMEGNLTSAINANPFGIIIFLVLMIGPIWLIFDYGFKKESLWKFYQDAEAFIRKKRVAIFLIVLVLANWIWNLNKGI